MVPFPHGAILPSIRQRTRSTSGPVLPSYIKRLGGSWAQSYMSVAKQMGHARTVMLFSTTRDSFSGGDVGRLFVVQLIAFDLPRILSARWNVEVAQSDSQREADDCGSEVRFPR